MLSQEGLDSDVIMFKDGNLWSVVNLTDDPSASVVTASFMPLNMSLKHCNEVSIVACCTVWNLTMVKRYSYFVYVPSTGHPQNFHS